MNVLKKHTQEKTGHNSGPHHNKHTMEDQCWSCDTPLENCLDLRQEMDTIEDHTTHTHIFLIVI